MQPLNFDLWDSDPFRLPFLEHGAKDLQRTLRYITEEKVFGLCKNHHTLLFSLVYLC